MKYILSIIIALATVLTMSAEPKKKFDIEAYRAEQHKFIKTKAQFTTDEATAFFRIFDEMRAKERQLFMQGRKERNKKFETEEEYRQSIIQHDNRELELKKIQVVYHKRMLKVAPAKKVLRAILASDDFDRMKFREMSAGPGNTQHP